jgi:hypothetical protein
LQSIEPLGEETLAPAADGVAIAVELRGDVQVGGLVVGGGAEDDAAAEGEGLGGGAGAGQGLQSGALFGRESDDRGIGERHDGPPGRFDQMVLPLGIMATDAPDD